jgi:O-antigen/teichoic acid export membrane protein
MTILAPAADLKDVVPNARHLSASQVIRRLFRMAILFVSARLLGVQAFGNYVVLLTVVEMVALISGYAYMEFLTREVARQPEAATPLMLRITALRLFYVVPALGLALMVLAILRFPGAITVDTGLLALALIPRAAGESAQGTMKGLRYFRPLPWIELLQGGVVLAGAATLLSLHRGIRGVILAEILGACAAAALSLSSLRRHLPPACGAAPGLPALAQSTAAFNLYPFIANAYDRVDVILLAKLKDSFAVGIYSLPYRAFATLQIIPYGLMGALLPAFSSSRDKGNVRETCSTVMRFLLLSSLFLVLVTLSFARPVILDLLGQGYADSIPTIKILVWASVPSFLNFALNTLLLSDRKERVFVRTAAVCTVFNIGANLFLIPRYSFIGAAIVTVLTECLLLAQNLYLIRKTMGWAAFPRDGVRITAIFAMVLAAFWALQYTIQPLLAGTLACSGFALSTGWMTRGLWHPAARATAGRTIDSGTRSLPS